MSKIDNYIKKNTQIDFMLFTQHDLLLRMEKSKWYSIEEVCSMIYGKKETYPDSEYQNIVSKLSKLRRKNLLEREYGRTIRVRYKRI